MNIGVLTVSDRCFAKETEDTSGAALVRALEPAFANASFTRGLVPDEITNIQATILQWESSGIDLIITTGGTGFAPRDNTPEAVAPLLHKMAPGLTTCLITKSLEETPFAMLSRLVCGVRNRTLIITLPGSPKAVSSCVKFLMPALPHALDLLKDNKTKTEATHKSMREDSQHNHHHHHHHGHHDQHHHHHDHHHHDHHHSHHGKPKTASGSKTHRHDFSNVKDRPRKSTFPMLPFAEAAELVFQCSAPRQVCTIQLDKALGLVLAETVTASEPLPPFPASIKDGYAVIHSDGAGEFPVVGAVTAGLNQDLKLEPGNVIRITTGAPIPPGADAVVQVEDTDLLEASPDGKEEKKIRILKAATKGQDIRSPGSDIAKDEVVLEKGTKLGPAEIGLLASVDRTEVRVYRRVSVALMSTGDEVVEPGQPLKFGQIRDSNRAMLRSALMLQHNCDVVDLGITGDDPDKLRTTLKEGLKHDILITSGGVSMGEKDMLKPLITELGGTIHFGRVFLKPGKPTTCASVPRQDLPDTLVLALPGNPVSCFVTFELFVAPAIRHMCGLQGKTQTIKARLADKVFLDPRPEFQRVTLNWSTEDGVPTALSTGFQRSSRLLSARSANALLRLPPRSDSLTELAKGALVDAIPLWAN
eukprot:m.74010 g.74010  ORF g.74010 m.74010 type:complete len:645 (-) comp20393_c0_seq1:96-2030(-)